MSVHVLRISLSRPAESGQFGRAFLVAALTTLADTSAVLNGMKCNLFVAPEAPTPLEVADGSFTPPGWTAYAATTVTNNPPTPEGLYGATMECVSVDWESPSDADETILGAWLSDSTGEVMIGYGLFDEPLPVSGVQTITVVPVLVMGD